MIEVAIVSVVVFAIAALFALGIVAIAAVLGASQVSQDLERNPLSTSSPDRDSDSAVANTPATSTTPVE